MEEQKDHRQDAQGCNCVRHSGHDHKHFVLRWLLGILILIIVFWLGVKIGEIKGYFGYGYGYYGNQRHHYMVPGYYGQSYPDMMNWQGPVANPPASQQQPGTLPQK